MCSAIPEPELLKGILAAIAPQKATFLWKLTARDQELLRNLSLVLPPHVRCHYLSLVLLLPLLFTSAKLCRKTAEPLVLATQNGLPAVLAALNCRHVQDSGCLRASYREAHAHVRAGPRGRVCSAGVCVCVCMQTCTRACDCPC